MVPLSGSHTILCNNPVLRQGQHGSFAQSYDKVSTAPQQYTDQSATTPPYDKVGTVIASIGKCHLLFFSYFLALSNTHSASSSGSILSKFEPLLPITSTLGYLD
jgi:hypothetical protein